MAHYLCMEPTPVILSAADLRLEIAGTVLLETGTFTIHEGERFGLVGRNGSGKSTLMKILADAESPAAGSVTRRRGLSVGYLPQEAQFPDRMTLRECILDGAGEVTRMLRRYESTALGSREHTELEAALTACDGWALERRLEQLSTAVKTPPLDRTVGTVSGGELRRTVLCRALIGQPDLLLLDEPTNHLDTESIEWLEEYLLRSRSTLLFVTHDRYFLDRLATRMLELDRREIHRYDGNYTAYLRGKAAREQESLLREARRQQFLRREIDWIRRAPKARGTKAQSRVQRLNEAANQEAYARDTDVDIIIPPAPRLAQRVVELHNAGLQLGGTWLFRGLDLELQAGQRLGIIGPNGMGKTSLLRLILGELRPTEGRIRVGVKTEFSYADQRREMLNNEKTVFDEVGEGKDFVQLGTVRLNLWSYLARYLFTDEEIRTRVGQLSGGERNRVLLARILKRGGNVLMLDEPTNDLDLSTLRVLEESLTLFTGCVLVVSHDRYFLNRVCTGILAFEGNGRVVYQEGDYDYYRQKLQARQNAVAATAAPTPKREWKPRDTVRKLKWKEERELEGMEERILAAESEVERLEGLFSTPDFFEKHGARTAELTAELEQARAHISQLYDRWEELERIKAGEVTEP